MSDAKLPRQRRRMPWWGWSLIAIAAATGLVAALGGFNDVPVDRLPTIEFGQTHVGNELATTVTGSGISSSTPVTGIDADEGEEYLVVEVTLANVQNRPNIFTGAVLRVFVDGVLDGNDEPTRVVELRSGGSVPALQPDLPTKVAFLWSVPKGSIERGDEIVVGVFERYDVPDDPRFDDYKSPPVPVLRIVTTVGARS